jgi:hypothetical protein
MWYLMTDGHFGLQRFKKTDHDDPDDVSLLNGTGLFANDIDYNKYIYEVVATSEEVRIPTYTSQFGQILKVCIEVNVFQVQRH